MQKPEGYEVQGVGYLQEEDQLALLKQIAEELIPANPGYGYVVKFQGGKDEENHQMVVTYHCMEMDLPYRIKEVESLADGCLKDFEKHVKKEYKKRAGKALKLKELKDMRETATEKVSLNNRYYYRSFRTYQLS